MKIRLKGQVGCNLHFHTLARVSITATYENRG